MVSSMKERVEKDTPGFNLVPGNQPLQGLLKNPLYSTVLSLQKQNHPILSDLAIKHKEYFDGAVFYITLKEPINKIDIENYQFEENHLTIHQYYQDKKTPLKNGLGMIHYTATYTHLENDDSIVIHVYFTKQGFFHYLQMKQYHGERVDEHYTELPFNSRQENEIRETIEDASHLVAGLLQENYRLYNEALQKAADIEIQLEQISKDFSKKSIPYYIKQAKLFVQLIQNVNDLSSCPTDRRGKLMAQQITVLQQEIEQKPIVSTLNEDTMSPKKVLPLAPASGKEESSDSNPQKEASVKYASKKFDEIKMAQEELFTLSLKITQSPQDIDLLLEQYNRINDLKLNLLLLSSLTKHLNSHQKKWIDHLDQSIENNKQLIDTFFQYFWKGNLDAVEKIFPYVEHLIQPNYIMEEILFKLVYCIPDNPEHEINLIKVFNFLYEQSSHYQFIVHSATTLFSLEKENKTFLSFLTLACRENNIFAFKLFLEQGMHPNNPGMIVGKLQMPAIFIITTLRNEEQKTPFLKLAFEFGAHYKVKAQPVQIDLKRTPGPARSLLNSKKWEKDDLLHQLSNFEGQSLMEFCLNIQNYSAIDFFLPQLSSNLEEMLSALAHLTNNRSIGKRNIIPSLKTGANVIKRIESLGEAQEQAFDKAQTTRFYSILIYSKTPHPSLDIIEKLLDAVQTEIKLLAEHSPHTLKQLQEKLLNNTKNSTPQQIEMIRKFDMCLFLLVCNPQPTFMIYQAILQLYCRRAAVAKNSITFYNEAFVSYGVARYLAEYSCFSEQLTKTPLYDFIRKQLASLLPDEEKQNLDNKLSRN